MSQFLFVNPYYEKYDGPITDNRLPPLELINCASLLQKYGHKSQIIDAHILKIRPSSINNHNITVNPEYIVVGTSQRNTWQCPPINIDPFYDTIQKLKQRFPDAYIIGTGPGSLFGPEKMLDFCDLVILEQPEYFFDTAAENFNRETLLNISGTMFKQKSGDIVNNPVKHRFNMAQLPVPNYELVPYKLYRHGIMNSWVVQLESTRGCPQFCNFCFQGMTHYKYNEKPVVQVIKEMRYVYEQLGGKDICFIDLDISVSSSYLNELLDAMIKEALPIRWSCNMRTKNFTPQLLQKMGQAKCKIIMVGIESANENIQSEMGKNKAMPELKRYLAIANNCGIQVGGYFLLGFPGETEQDVYRTIKLSTQLDINYASFSLAIPYPTLKGIRQEDTLPEKSRLNVSIGFKSNVSLKRLKQLQTKAYRKFYLRPHYILKNFSLLLNPKILFSNFQLFLKAAINRS